MTGKLYGVSVGPGDPQLMTLAAKARIEQAEVIAFVRTPRQGTFALDIIKEVVDLSGKILLELPFIMQKSKDLRAERYRENAAQITDYLKNGRDVCMINLGDVSLYSTFSYMDTLIRHAGFETQWIPGVTSISAGACAARVPLAAMDQAIHILPGSFSDPEDLSLPGTKVVMKSAGSFKELRETILELHEDAFVVENIGLPTERIEQLREVEEAGYFTLIYMRDSL